MEHLTVGNAMTREVIAVAPDTSLSSAARLLMTQRISGAPVIDADGRPRGVVTLRDLADPDRKPSTSEGLCVYYRLVDGAFEAQGDAVVSEDGVVADVMTPYVLAVGPATPLLEAIRTMSAEGIHRLLVAEDGKLVGIVTSLDVLRAIALWSRENPGLPVESAAR